ncbi:unnamed protein product [Mytilus edulis]|uniref:G-protein coupled receptors family 1 profile domain-containing protein n=1 Tax=Mytilus edulis TaxID=6550 RepID=A0A8S3SSF8_MYTED|nr:unnamed protein product [Mytilus edulis]
MNKSHLTENITENITITTSIIPEIGGDPPRRPTLQEILMAYSEYVWAVNLGTYVFPIIIGLGTIGNVLSFLIMIRRTMIITPTCFYMAILAISDTTILYVDCLRKWVFLIKAHRRQKTLHGNPTSNKSASHNRSSINHRMTAMLLSVTFTFIIMTAPKTILFCIRNEVFMFLKYNTYDFQEIALYTLITRIADLCMYTNHAINFFLYCVSGQRFRKEMKQLFYVAKSRSASLSLYSSKFPPSSRYQTMQTVSRGSYENDNGLESYHTMRTVSSNLGSNNNENCQDVNEQNERENSL